MNKKLILLLLFVQKSFPSELGKSVFDYVKNGVYKAGEIVQEGARRTGEVVSNIADALPGSDKSSEPITSDYENVYTPSSKLSSNSTSKKIIDESLKAISSIDNENKEITIHYSDLHHVLLDNKYFDKKQNELLKSTEKERLDIYAYLLIKNDINPFEEHFINQRFKLKTDGKTVEAAEEIQATMLSFTQLDNVNDSAYASESVSKELAQTVKKQ